MNLRRFARLSKLFSRVLRYSESARPPSDVVETADICADGTSYDLYRPRRPVRATVVCLHGLSVAGAREPRLVHFARCLAESGVACALPMLPGLAGCRSRIDDLDRVVATVTALDAPRVGLIGFSYGGSYALLAAARNQLLPRVRFVVSFGAYHSLVAMLASYADLWQRRPATPAENDDLIYLRLVMTQRAPQLLPDPELRAQAGWLLHRFCHQASDQEKQAFFDAHLAGLDFAAVAEAESPATMEALSPAGKLQGLACPVSLVHDRNDTLVPPAEAERLFAELSAGETLGGHRLLITGLLSHVTPASVLHPGELGRLFACLEPMVEDD